jgi:hypothetical protein
MGAMRIASVIGNGLHRVSPRAARIAKKVWRLRHPPLWNKAHIINHLATTRGYRNYLELCTPTSGGRYAEIEFSEFENCIRLMYNCPDSHVPLDCLPIDYRTTSLDIRKCLSSMRADGHLIDIALIDSFHDYDHSLRDLVEVFGLISDGGTLIVHDCLPPKPEIAQPQFTAGEWCGVTYQAFIDFVSHKHDLEFYTVNTDYGCGVIHKQTTPTNAKINKKREDSLAKWQKKGDDSWATFALFESHKQTLMNVISVKEFLERNPRRRWDWFSNPFHHS